MEHPKDGSPMVLIPEGHFLMGAPEGDFLAEEHEKPQRQVHLAGYWIDVYPVTNLRFALFLDSGGYEQPTWWSIEGWTWKCKLNVCRPSQWAQPGWDGPDQPVAGVSWYEADAFARWAGRRLPTDAEWEKAARGCDGRRYPWGNEWPNGELANFDMRAGRTTPVGLFREGASPFGCLDMAGNVNNWTSDWYWPRFGYFCVELQMLRNPHLHDHLRDHISYASITEKVDRGGGFATPNEFHEVLGCTRKTHWPPSAREAWNGFRTAMAIGEERQQPK
jgi:formylglycine-generating enzyme required for sulfatase activity